MRALGVFLPLAAATWVVTGGMAGAASTATTTVSVTVASATSLNAAGCASGTANVTDFGTVLPATSNVTSADCAVVFGSSNDTSMLRAYQTDTSGTALVGMPNGSLDTTFDGDGMLLTAVGGLADKAYGVAVQSDGKIVLAGVSQAATNDFAVVRYATNGSLDATFDTDGKQTTAIGAGNDNGWAIAIQGDGKIVVAGQSNNGANDDFAVVRYNTDGSLDGTFDTDGKQTTAVGTSNDYAYGVAIQADGKIVVAGVSDNGANDDFAVVRYNSNGSLDTSFDTDGKQTTAIGAGADVANAVAVQGDGKIVLAGRSWNGTSDDFAAARYSTSGALDGTFDTDGKQTTAIGASGDVAYAVALQGDGKIVLGGNAWNGTTFELAAVRYTTGGGLDATFDADGMQTTSISANAGYARGIAIQGDGKIVLGGYASNGANNDFVLARYTTGGALDTSFDTDGKVITSLSSSHDYGFGMALQADGKIVLAGISNGTNDDFAVARYGGGGTVADWAGSWGAANLFGACLHTVANATNTWTLAGSGNCTTAIDANWNALPTTASKIAWAGSGVTNATTNLRYGFKATASQQAGTYVAPLTFEVVAPNA